MSLVVVDLGEVELLRWTLFPDGTRPANLEVMLFKSDSEVYRNSVIGDFEESDFAGYSRFVMAWEGWTPPGLIGGAALSYWAAEPVTFEASAGSQTIYGYLVVTPDESIAIWGERFAEPHVIDTTNPIAFAPYMRGRSEVEPVPPPPP